MCATTRGRSSTSQWASIPITLDTDSPAFRRGLERLYRISNAIAAAKERGGPLGQLTRAAYGVAGLVTFAQLYLLPTLRHDLPSSIRMRPAW